MVVLLAIAGWGFKYIPQQFMPLLNKQYFSIDMWLPEGTRIEESERQAAQLTEFLQTFDGIKKCLLISDKRHQDIIWLMLLTVRNLIMLNV